MIRFPNLLNPTVVDLDRPTSRRRLLAGSAKLAGAGGLALAVGVMPGGRSSRAAASSAGTTDLEVLQQLLALEQMQSTLYRDGLWQFAVDESTGDRLLPKYPSLVTIHAHEQRHIALLSDAIKDLGGTPVTPGSYDFGYEDFAGFLQVAAEIENIGITAYAGATAALTDPALRAKIAGVLSVEGRHAAFLNARIGESPFPAAEDEAQTANEIAALAARFTSA